MTSEVKADDSATSEVTEKPWATHELRGRVLTFQAPSPEQLMILRRLSRKLGDDSIGTSRQLLLIANVLDAVSALFIKQEDSDYVDELVLNRIVEFEELGPMIHAALNGPNAKKTAPKNGPAKRVRRR